MSYQDKLLDFEREMIRQAIPTANTITQLATNLGLKRTTLIMRAKRLGMFEQLPRDRAVPRTVRQKIEDARRAQV